MPNEQPPEGAKPGKRTLHNPAPTIPPKGPAVLGRRTNTVLPVRAHELNLTPSQAAPQSVGIVSPVSNNPGWLLAGPSGAISGNRNGFQKVVDQLHLSGRRRGNGHSHRNTLAVDQNHALRTFPPLGTADCVAPFLAGKNEASTNTFSHCNFCRSSSLDRKARQISSQVSSFSHWLRRRQQVDGLGYSDGRSLHRAPVFRTQRIPSMPPGCQPWAVQPRDASAASQEPVLSGTTGYPLSGCLFLPFGIPPNSFIPLSASLYNRDAYKIFVHVVNFETASTHSSRRDSLIG